MSARSSRRRRGFTLIEVLLVLAILVILGGTVAFYFAGMQKRGFEDSAKTQLGEFEKQLSLYHLDVGTFPQSSQGLEALRRPPADLDNPQKWRGPYAAKDIPLDPWGKPYQYEAGGDGSYRIWSLGADGQDNTEDDVAVIGS